MDYIERDVSVSVRDLRGIVRDQGEGGKGAGERGLLFFVYQVECLLQ